MHSSFLKILENQFLSLADPLKGMRSKAWDHFLEKGMPEREFAYSFVSGEVAPQEACVFVNGAYRKDLSLLPKNCVVMPLSEAMNTYGIFLLSRFAKKENNPLALLNAALHPEGLFIFVPPGASARLHIAEFITAQTQAFSRIHIFVGAAAELTLSMTQKAEATAWLNGFIDVALEERASCRIAARSSKEMEAVRATLKKESSFSFISAREGGEQDIQIALLGEECSAEVKGLVDLKDKDKAATRILMDHQAPHTRSHQLIKALLQGVSRSAFEGKILVRKEAQKTEAYQLNQNLLLDDYAIAQCKPNLEIFADDVKASHGATVSQIDEEQLFYMQARGVSRKVATQLLKEAFCQEILQYV